MKKIVSYLLMFTATTVVLSQNLVTNGDFEQYSQLPSGYGQFYLADPWMNLNGNISGTPYGSPDYFHENGFNDNVFGKISPQSGQGQMGVCTFHSSYSDFREYISVALKSPLVKGENYVLSFYLSSGKNGTYNARTNNFGVHLSEDSVNQTLAKVVTASAHIKITSVVDHNDFWKKYTYTFRARNNSKYITFGNFDDDASTTITSGYAAYTFIDNIRLESEVTWDTNYRPTDPVVTSFTPLKPQAPVKLTDPNVSGIDFESEIPLLDLGRDTILCEGDFTVIDAYDQKYSHYRWQDGSTNSKYRIEKAGIYWLTAGNKYGSRTDTITVDFKNCHCRVYVPNSFTPNADGVNDIFVPQFNCQVDNYHLYVFNRWGDVVFESTDIEVGWDGQSEEGENQLGMFTYRMIYQFEGENEVDLKGKLVLIR